MCWTQPLSSAQPTTPCTAPPPRLTSIPESITVGDGCGLSGCGRGRGHGVAARALARCLPLGAFLPLLVSLLVVLARLARLALGGGRVFVLALVGRHRLLFFNLWLLGLNHSNVTALWEKQPKDVSFKTCSLNWILHSRKKHTHQNLCMKIAKIWVNWLKNIMREWNEVN